MYVYNPLSNPKQTNNTPFKHQINNTPTLPCKHQTTNANQQILLPDDLPALSLLMLAGGAGVYAGSAVSAHVDMSLFRRLLVLLLLLGANVMLFAGAPAKVALGGVASISGGVALYILALWNQPVWPPGKGPASGSGGVLRRWLGGALYTQVSLDEEEMIVDFQHQERVEGGDGGRLERGGEVELTATASATQGSSREIHI